MVFENHIRKSKCEAEAMTGAARGEIIDATPVGGGGGWHDRYASRLQRADPSVFIRVCRGGGVCSKRVAVVVTADGED